MEKLCLEVKWILFWWKTLKNRVNNFSEWLVSYSVLIVNPLTPHWLMKQLSIYEVLVVPDTITYACNLSAWKDGRFGGSQWYMVRPSL